MPQSPRFLAPGHYDPVKAKQRLRSIVKALDKRYPDPQTSLTYETPFQLLVATILSAQTTDEGVNKVTPVLFGRYPDAASLANASPGDVELIIKSTGFFRQKTKAIIGAARKITGEFGDEVPSTMAELTTVPGAARKTANVVLANIKPRPLSDHGIFVDTHIRRVSQRLGLTEHEDPNKIERDLMDLLPEKYWIRTPHQMIFLGREICHARNPKHDICPLLRWCPTGQAALAEAPPPGKSRPARDAKPRSRAKPKPQRRLRRMSE
ncbi:MAG: endonuclease III [Actinobacteria bacterium]|nr:endonuclease III [Actinomycetota bacterium]